MCLYLLLLLSFVHWPLRGRAYFSLFEIILFYIFSIILFQFHFIQFHFILFNFILFWVVCASYNLKNSLVVFHFYNELQHMHKQKMELPTCVWTSSYFCHLLTDSCWGRMFFSLSEIILFFHFLLLHFLLLHFLFLFFYSISIFLFNNFTLFLYCVDKCNVDTHTNI